eukprot:m.26282 g.26282  ORF g.26282 m.26282 type:complete len:58 (+) comp4563_c0_seq2:560-733(+)
MCRKVKCNGCSKWTWAGCGQHIDSAMSGVDKDERCPGWEKGVCTVDPSKGKDTCALM